MIVTVKNKSKLYKNFIKNYIVITEYQSIHKTWMLDELTAWQLTIYMFFYLISTTK